MRYLIMLLLVAGAAMAAGVAGLPAVVHKASVAVHSAPDFDASIVTTLKRDAPVTVAGQDGLWYQLALDGGATGYVRVNEIRVAHSSAAGSDDTMHILLTGQSGRGRISETAGVRGIDESDLRSAAFDATQLAQMESHRVSPQAAADYAANHGLTSTPIAWEGEAAPVRGDVAQADARKGTSVARGLFGSISRGMLGSVLGVAEEAIPKSEAELAAEELALGPLIAGRVLGARPLWADADAQRRVNLVGRWLASQTSRPDLPWAFGVIDSPEYNAFAAPGGYVLVTRGLYQLVDSDAELAAVLGHEINHVVQRDHYEVIRKQGLMAGVKDLASSQIHTGGGLAGSLARDYVEQHGATILLTSLDRDAEFRADQVAEVYLARSGMNPLALYAMLQKMSAMGSPSGGLAQLYKTHPSLDDRLDRIDRRGYGALEPYLQRVTVR